MLPPAGSKGGPMRAAPAGSKGGPMLPPAGSKGGPMRPAPGRRQLLAAARSRAAAKGSLTASSAASGADSDDNPPAELTTGDAAPPKLNGETIPKMNQDAKETMPDPSQLSGKQKESAGKAEEKALDGQQKSDGALLWDKIKNSCGKVDVIAFLDSGPPTLPNPAALSPTYVMSPTNPPFFPLFYNYGAQLGPITKVLECAWALIVDTIKFAIKQLFKIDWSEVGRDIKKAAENIQAGLKQVFSKATAAASETLDMITGNRKLESYMAQNAKQTTKFCGKSTGKGRLFKKGEKICQDHTTSAGWSGLGSSCDKDVDCETQEDNPDVVGPGSKKMRCLERGGTKRNVCRFQDPDHKKINPGLLRSGSYCTSHWECRLYDKNNKYVPGPKSVADLKQLSYTKTGGEKQMRPEQCVSCLNNRCEQSTKGNRALIVSSAGGDGICPGEAVDKAHRVDETY